MSFASRSSVRPALPSAPGDVRIIGGRLRRSKLPVKVSPGLRPTPDRVRETVFNWLGQTLEGLRCVDAFAGTGALAVEAASRGAVEVVAIERDNALAKHLQVQVQRLQAPEVRVLSGDALAVMAGLPASAWDVVFLDPPFMNGDNRALVMSALQAARRLIQPDGRVYLEAPNPWTTDDLLPMGLSVHRQGKAGQVHYHLLTPTETLL